MFMLCEWDGLFLKGKKKEREGCLHADTRPVQDRHDDRSPRLVKHSGIRQQQAVLVGGPKVWVI